MPTSLTYIVLWARGCSPWRPAAVMSTNGRENQSVPRLFKGRRRRTGLCKKCRALPIARPYLLANRFHGRRIVNKKRELFPGSPPTSSGSVALPQTRQAREPSAISAFRFGNINPIPFRRTEAWKASHPDRVPLRLRID